MIFGNKSKVIESSCVDFVHGDEQVRIKNLLSLVLKFDYYVIMTEPNLKTGNAYRTKEFMVVDGDKFRASLIPIQYLIKTNGIELISFSEKGTPVDKYYITPYEINHIEDFKKFIKRAGEEKIKFIIAKDSIIKEEENDFVSYLKNLGLNVEQL